MNIEESMDTQFDYLMIHLSERGFGDWVSFLKAIKAVGIEDSAFGIARRLCTLAHLDFDYLSGEKKWNMVTPSLIQTSQPGQAPMVVLCGKRNPELVKVLLDHASRLGVVARVDRQFRAPAVITVLADREDTLATLAYQAGIGFAHQGSWTICLTMPSLDILAKQHPKEPGVFGEVDRFDEWPLRWRRLKRDESQSIGDGVFRYGPPFNKSHALSIDGQFYRVEGEVGIWWALKRIGRYVMRYHTARQELSTPFYLDLPIPWSRALTLASGFLPDIHDNRRFYRNVPISLAKLVSSQMGQTLEEIND